MNKYNDYFKSEQLKLIKFDGQKDNIKINQRKVASNKYGIYAQVYLGEGVTYKKILEKAEIKITNKDQSINFIRGMMDNRTSPDQTTNYLAMDLCKTEPTLQMEIIDKILSLTNFRKLTNINTRFENPSQNSKEKNNQFRVKFDQYLNYFGTMNDLNIKIYLLQFLSKYNKFNDLKILYGYNFLKEKLHIEESLFYLDGFFTKDKNEDKNLYVQKISKLKMDELVKENNIVIESKQGKESEFKRKYLSFDQKIERFDLFKNVSITGQPLSLNMVE
jgi:hypothetical protein